MDTFRSLRAALLFAMYFEARHGDEARFRNYTYRHDDLPYRFLIRSAIFSCISDDKLVQTTSEFDEIRDETYIHIPTAKTFMLIERYFTKFGWYHFDIVCDLESGYRQYPKLSHLRRQIDLDTFDDTLGLER